MMITQIMAIDRPIAATLTILIMNRQITTVITVLQREMEVLRTAIMPTIIVVDIHPEVIAAVHPVTLMPMSKSGHLKRTLSSRSTPAKRKPQKPVRSGSLSA